MPRIILWCDAEANCTRLNNQLAVAELINNAKNANVDTIIVDVKPLSGEVLYLSNIAPRLNIVDGYQYPSDFDLLATMITEGHNAGIEVHAGINVFCEGHRQWGRGPAYNNRNWQVVSYEADRIIDFPNSNQIRVEKIDPWDRSASPTIFTKKTGSSLETLQDRCYLVIHNDVIENMVLFENIDTSIPENGCILAIDEKNILDGIQIGDKIKWSTIHTKRVCEDSQIPSWGIFVNPIGSAKEYELNIVKEIVGNYDIDGIVFDRMRYPNIYADFSELSLDSFSRWLGIGKTVYPDDIFLINDKPWLPIIPGRLFKRWLEWRASRINDFAKKAVDTVRSLKPEIETGIYVGSWYESYYDVGVNWGSKNYHPGYDWMTPGYNHTGYSELFDYICTGCYYPVISRADARRLGKPEGATVEAGCQLSVKAINGASCVYGSLYLRDYNDNPDNFHNAVNMAVSETDGVMLFDLVYIEKYNWWPLLQDITSKK
ncbi:MAG: alpha amylase family protein [Armatimonadota bacterium]